MCGVVAVLGKKSASTLVIEGLKKLEYRGYDSAGIATLGKRSVKAIKSKGKLNNLINSFSKQKKEKFFFDNSIAIGHTRWELMEILILKIMEYFLRLACHSKLSNLD